METKERGKQNKPVAYFKGMDKGFVINKLNWSTIAQQHGDESDEWVGKQITLHAVEAEAFGEIALRIRVMLPRRQPAAPKVVAPPTDTTAAPGTDDAAITAYWLKVKQFGMTREEGLKLLNQHKLNFTAATAALVADTGDTPF